MTPNTVVDMANGEVQLLVPPEVMTLLGRQLCQNELCYSTVRGETSLIENYVDYLAEKYSGIDLTHRNILVTSGAKFGLWFLLDILCDMKRSILLPRPAWPAYKMWSEEKGTEIRYYSLTGVDPYRELLEKIVDRSVALAVLNFPHNPTGWELNQVKLEALCAAASRCDTIIVCDEVLREFALEDASSTALRVINRYNNVVVVDSVSKWFGMAGLRLGFIAANEGWIEAIAHRHDAIGGSVPTLVQTTVGRLLKSPLARRWFRDLTSLCDARAQAIAARLTDSGYRITGKGGLYVWVKDLPGCSSEQIELNGIKIAVAKGAHYNMDGYFRVCPAKDPDICLPSL